jgi:hypothetical protein
MIVSLSERVRVHERQLNTCYRICTKTLMYTLRIKKHIPKYRMTLKYTLYTP